LPKDLINKKMKRKKVNPSKKKELPKKKKIRSRNYKTITSHHIWI
jgi:hypothetical protein